MSVPRNIRVAIQACRPLTTSRPKPRIEYHARAFSSTQFTGSQDITTGFPTPPTPGGSQQEKKLVENIPDTPTIRNSTAATNRPQQSKSSPLQIKSEQPTPPAVLDTVEAVENPDAEPRVPRNVAAAYHKPLRIEAELGVVVASLQLRSYSVRSLELMCDFALRAAYFLNLSASGPTPLPKRIERWTMPRSNFVHKKSQENFERITMKRLISIKDGHKDTVQIWLAYLRKHAFYGVGMKANVWEYESLDVAANMDRQFQQVEKELDAKLANFGWNKQVANTKSITEMVRHMGPGQQVAATGQHIRDASRSAHKNQLGV